MNIFTIRGPMQERSLTIPELILIAGTRVALGAGLGLLVGDKLSRDVRESAGWALVEWVYLRPSLLLWGCSVSRRSI
jgi:hypothetical protein